VRKYIIGLGVAFVFLAYSVGLRHQRSGSIIAPASLSQNTSSASPGSSNSKTTTTPTTTSPSTTNTTTSSKYKDGTFKGSVENAFYGQVQVSATISGGQLSSVNILQYPNDNPNSQYINQTALPYLKQEAIKAQSSNVSLITGATFSSQAFVQSLANALNLAKQG
jgi:uncharacterized protein with FMN-binding domain